MTTVANVYKAQLLVLVDSLIVYQLIEMWKMKKVSIEVVETVGSALNVISMSVIVAMKRFIVTKTALLMMFFVTLNQQSFLMVHTEFTMTV